MPQPGHHFVLTLMVAALLGFGTALILLGAFGIRMETIVGAIIVFMSFVAVGWFF